MTPHQFVGTWRLVSTEIRDAEGARSELHGADATGYLIYTPEGYMSAHLNCPHPPSFESIYESFVELSPALKEELAAIERPTYVSYCAKYEIVPPNKIIHHLELSSTSDLEDVEERWFKFFGNQLELSVPLPLEGKEATCYLVWERI